ncbi:MAG: serine/threonine protein kinase [Phycisphaeraceae bacterium]|nr:serine/threonine protein kinase [Phycisphaeraceae bacterium]
MTTPPRKQDLTETSPMDPASTEGGVPGLGGTGVPDAKERTRSSSNIDTIIGRIVVDQGLATSEEVQQCLELARSAMEENQRSLSELLVANEYITKRQLLRLKQIADAERSGQQIPGYKLLGKLGAGAMATVYKARQLSLDRLVAIKVLPRKFTQSAQFIERFYAEGRSAAQLNHPNIVQAYDVGKAGDYHYFVMEYVEGRTVYDDIVKHKRFEERDAIDITMQIAEALLHAHDRGLIHRDVKPKNMMITKEGVAKLADMGLARAITDKEAAEAEQGKAFGTPYYISPEQIRGELKIGPPADIYSLGATLYHMVTGSVPFDGKNPSAVMHHHLKSPLVPPDHVNPKLSAGISEVIEMMMAKDPRKRYQSCKDLLLDLRAVRDKKDPPIAHRDIGGADLASLAKAEAAAPALIQEDQSARQAGGVALWLFVTMCVLLVISVAVNIFLAVRSAG